MEFLDYVKDRTFDFYGVCDNEFKLDNEVFEAIEDESDGYRSYLDSIRLCMSDGIFFKEPIAKVRIEEIDNQRNFEGYALIDVADGHIWLRVGTDDFDDYYPCFRFDYRPKSEENHAA